jgi:hypothetical protein
MSNPTAPTEGGGRRIPFLVDPDNPGNAYLPAGKGGLDMGAGRTEGAATYAVPVPADTAARTSVASASSDTLLLAANADRLGAYIFNASTAILYVGLGTTAVTSSNCTWAIAAGGAWVVPDNFTGQIRGCWASVNGAAKVTELTSSLFAVGS